MQPDDMLQALLELEESALLERLGGELADGHGAFKQPAVELINIAKRWLATNLDDISDAVCNSPRVRELSDTDHDSLNLAVFDAVSLIVTGLTPVILTALIVKKGLPVLCKKHWGSSHEK